MERFTFENWVRGHVTRCHSSVMSITVHAKCVRALSGCHNSFTCQVLAPKGLASSQDSPCAICNGAHMELGVVCLQTLKFTLTGKHSTSDPFPFLSAGLEEGPMYSLSIRIPSSSQTMIFTALIASNECNSQAC
jgi:hypothetical protein